MRKFFVTLLILIILGGTGFFFGWAQLTVPPGAYGVVSSKTHGVDPRPIRSGEFRWIWYKLIPTNVEIQVFRLDSVNSSISIKNTLPSGSTYAAFAGISEDFSWELNASISFRVNPDNLVSLVSENNITSQEALASYEQGLVDRIKVFILQRLVSDDPGGVELEGVLTGGSGERLIREINNHFPEILDFSFIVSSAHFPDFALYKQVRVLFENFVEKQQEYISAALDERAEKRIDARLRITELESLGQLLTKYPILLEYLGLEKGLE